MRFGHVQRLEVVEIQLHLGAFCYFETKSDEDIFQARHRLGDDVGMTSPMLADVFAEVHPLARHSLGMFAIELPRESYEVVVSARSADGTVHPTIVLPLGDRGGSA